MRNRESPFLFFSNEEKKTESFVVNPQRVCVFCCAHSFSPLGPLGPLSLSPHFFLWPPNDSTNAH